MIELQDPPQDRPAARPLQAAIDYFATGMRGVRGFLTQGSSFALLTLLEVQRRDGIRGPITEIGTFHGKALIGFGLATLPDEAVVGVDLFVVGTEDFEASLRTNWDSVGLPLARLCLHRGSSMELGTQAWAALLAAPARLVHVDGEHTRSAAAHDLALAASFLAPGGVIVVDDVLHAWYPDITLAVAAFLEANPDFRAFAIIDREADLMRGGAKMMIARREDVPRYDEALRFCLPRSIVRRTAFAGSTPLVIAFAPDHVKRLLPLAAR
ncbi:class I SAM-dependent methyltransferase [Roseomonas rosulenta]|uniref:class I SAM-dependent methyltransferase n=1 Tax=Roseomonas rosulenta TaxID=2748667 RepID=UPI0018DFB507|nr:class I SAM-dependent methyltransferase [Roseomonas rosulenta]